MVPRESWKHKSTKLICCPIFLFVFSGKLSLNWINSSLVFPCGTSGNPPANAWDESWIPGFGRSLEKEMTTHSRILARRIPWAEEPARLWSTVSPKYLTWLKRLSMPHAQPIIIKTVILQEINSVRLKLKLYLFFFKSKHQHSGKFSYPEWSISLCFRWSSSYLFLCMYGFEVKQTQFVSTL